MERGDEVISDATTLWVPIYVCINLRTAELILGIFIPFGVFVWGDDTYENLGEL